MGLAVLPVRPPAQRPFVAPPFAGGLISNPRVIGAIRQAGYRVAATEKEVVTTGVADRPAAGLLVEFQNGPALADWNDVVDQFRFGLQFEIVSMRQCRIATDRCAADAQHMRRRTRLARPRRRARTALGAAGEPEPMHFADHGIA